MLVFPVIGTGTAGYNGDGMSGNMTQLSSPLGVAVLAEHLGWYYAADTGNNCIRKLISVGAGSVTIVSNVAGTVLYCPSYRLSV